MKNFKTILLTLLMALTISLPSCAMKYNLEEPPDDGLPKRHKAEKRSDVKDKIKACIFGAAIGDALGRVTEFKDIAGIYKKYENIVVSFDDFKEGDFVEKNGKKVALYTDDTQMAMIVLKQCKRKLFWNKHGMDALMSDLAKDFVAWVNDPDGGNIQDSGGLAHLRAPGNTCIASCKELERRINWRNSFSGACLSPLYYGSQWWACGKGDKKFIQFEGGSGAVMRAWPFGLCFHENPKLAAEWSAQHSKLTHRNPISLAACAAIATGVAYAMQSVLSVKEITNKMIAAAEKYNMETADTMRMAVQYAHDESMLSDAVFADKDFQGWDARTAIAATVYIFNKSPNDLRQALVLGVNTPGDSDTIATLAGALVGAYSGRFDQISQKELDVLEDSDEFMRLAQNVCHMCYGLN